MSLIADNTFRTPWLAAKLLSNDANVAKEAAASLARHLASTRPSNRTNFEKHMFETECLWKDLVDFSETDPPSLLWHRNGQFVALFRFLAPRFLLSPDNVLDAERVHARWQWSCSIKRSLKIHNLNAILRLTHYLENQQRFPDHDDLWMHLQAERAQHAVNLRAIDNEGDIAVG